MSRDIPSALQTELDKQAIRYTILGFFDFADGATRLWAGPRGENITWDGNTWLGVGELGSIDKITEPGDLRSSRTVATLKMTSDMLDHVDIDGEANRGNDAEFRLLFFDANNDFSSEIVIPFEMGSMEADFSLEATAEERVVVEAIKLTLLGRQELLGRSFNRRFTLQDTLEIDSDDFGHEWASDPDLGILGSGLSDSRGGETTPGRTQRLHN